MARNGTLSPATVNPLGFYTAQARKSGTLLDFVCNEKEKHPDKIIFVRVGEFFATPHPLSCAILQVRMASETVPTSEGRSTIALQVDCDCADIIDGP